MQSEDHYMERTPDLVTKIRALREAAERGMNRFTRVADYDVRRVVGQKPTASSVSIETTSPSPAAERTRRSNAKSSTAQISMEFGPTAAKHGDDEENA